MSQNFKVLIGVLILTVLTFFVGKCTNTPDTIVKTITLPAIKGKSDTIYKPINNTKIIEKSYVYRDSIIVHDKEFDKKIVDKFASLNSEYEKIKAYVKANEINTYQIPIEDSLIKTVSNIKVKGELLSYQRDYFLKERNIPIEIKVPKTVFKLSAGVGLKSNTSLDNFTPTANVILTNYKGNSLLFQAGLDGSVQAGVSLSVFEIKR